MKDVCTILKNILAGTLVSTQRTCGAKRPAERDDLELGSVLKPVR